MIKNILKQARQQSSLISRLEVSEHRSCLTRSRLTVRKSRRVETVLDRHTHDCVVTPAQYSKRRKTNRSYFVFQHPKAFDFHALSVRSNGRSSYFDPRSSREIRTVRISNRYRDLMKFGRSNFGMAITCVIQTPCGHGITTTSYFEIQLLPKS